MLNNSRNQIFQYNGSPISFQKGDSVMVNATEMAKPFGKRPAKWLELPSTKEFLVALTEVRKSDFALIQTDKGGINSVSESNFGLGIKITKLGNGAERKDPYYELTKKGYLQKIYVFVW